MEAYLVITVTIDLLFVYLQGMKAYLSVQKLSTLEIISQFFSDMIVQQVSNLLCSNTNAVTKIHVHVEYLSFIVKIPEHFNIIVYFR